MRLLKKFLIQPKSLILIFIVTALVAVSSAFIELNQSKLEMLELMEKQGHSVLETVLASSKNALVSYNKIESEIKNRLLNNAQTIKLLDQKGFLNNRLIEKIAQENSGFRINILSANGNILFSSQKDIQNSGEEENLIQLLFPILNGEKDTLIIGINQTKLLEDQRFTVVLATDDRKVIVVSIDAGELLNFRKEVGFGMLLKKVTESPEIVYAALQDENEILAGSGAINDLDNIKSDQLIQSSLKQNSYKWRVIKKDSLEAFEVIHPFKHDGKTIGIFRLGLSLNPLNKINERLTRRIITISIILFIFGFVTITLIFLRQNFSLLSKRFKAVESYSSQIVDNVSDGIVVMNSQKKITLINKAAKSILSIPVPIDGEVSFESVFHATACQELWSSASRLMEIHCVLNGKPKTILFSLSEFTDEHKSINYILVFRDLTEQKLLEQQSLRNDKMIAMGELASSVAHEIRNPLNSIGTIAQQIGKDYEVKENETEFKSLTSVVYTEVKRINEIIESFLRFAKPQPIKPESFSIKEFFDDLARQYLPIFLEKKINFETDLNYQGMVVLDKSQMKQAFINLIENSINAFADKGVISIKTTVTDGNLKILFADNGAGIDTDKLDRIFDLYFTSKKKGNGIGLSIVHKIISGHGGTISVSSKKNMGTEFMISLPLFLKEDIL